MNIRLVNKDATAYDDTGNYYDFTDNFIFNDRTIEGQSQVEDLILGDGGLQVGNNYLKSRTISLTGRFKADSVSNSEDKINTLLSFIINGQPLKMYVIGESTRRYLKNVYFNNLTETDIIHKDYQTISLSFDVTYPKWINDIPSTSTHSSVTSGATITVTNNAGWQVFPQIQITTAAANATFRIKNTSDQNLTCKVSDPIYTTGEVITIDSVEGTIKKGNVNIVQYLEGTFLKLLPGNNILKYIGSATVDIALTWREEQLK